MRRWLDSARRVSILSAGWPVTLLGAVVVLFTAGLISLIALRSGTAEQDYVTGSWRIGLVVHNGPVLDSIGESLFCSGVFNQISTAIEGELDCTVLGRSAEVTGFVSFERDAVAISAQFDQSTIEIVADVISSVQIVGRWEDSQGFSGRFVAIREQLSINP